MKVEKTILASGNEAVALGAISSNIDFFSHYPGSPVNFVEPALKDYAKNFAFNLVFNDSLNEHIAALSAGGASFTGARSMVVMKHVGLNIAADPLTYLAYTGVIGGMVVVVGTDPGANASTGEQDVHWYARMFNIPVFEPTTVGEVYSQCVDAYDLSEKYQLPIFLFLPSRLAYASERINFTLPSRKNREFQFIRNRENYINVGIRNIANHNRLLNKISAISEQICHIKEFGNNDSETAIITRGMCFPLVFETLEKSNTLNNYHFLNLDLVFPLPINQLKKKLEKKTKIYIIEDQDGFLEQELKMKLFNSLRGKVFGKEFFPACGEIQLDHIHVFFREQLQIDIPFSTDLLEGDKIPECLGTFCEGCPHRSVFYVLDKLIRDGIPGIIGGDIGCSSLPPFRADWLMCMNSGIGISQGISQMKTGQMVFSTGGDGSFFHNGLLSLKSAVDNSVDLLHLVLDNKTIAMTGHQKSPSSGKKFKPGNLLREIGVDRYYIIKANHLNKIEKVLRRECGRSGVRVIWIEGVCSRIKNPLREFKKEFIYPEIRSENCGECSLCYDELSCPAIVKKGVEGKFGIDTEICERCGSCRVMCPEGAVRASYNMQILKYLKYLYRNA